MTILFFTKCSILSKIVILSTELETLTEHYYVLTIEVVRISSCLQIFNYNPESTEDIHLAHIDPKTRPIKPLSNPHTNDLFWCGLHHSQDQSL